MSRQITSCFLTSLFVVLIAAIFIVTRLELKVFKTNDNGTVSIAGKESAFGDRSIVGAGSATSGRLFKGRPFRTFDTRVFTGSDYKPIASNAIHSSVTGLNCKRWSVVTTIFKPSDAVKKQALMTDWCLVVVGDLKGPPAYDIQAPSKNFIFLTAEMQKNMSSDFPLIRFLPWNHFGRKNVGYLYAILHGATTIWDFDDDNILLTNDNIFEMIPVVKGVNGSSLPDSVTVREAVGYGGLGQLSFNPYPLMGCPSSPCWPRGLPLSDIKFNHSSVVFQESKIPMETVGVVQSLANKDPDVDAIYRLTHTLPFDFPTTGKFVAVPSTAYAPYNAQATLHLQPALWSLMLPVTVHGRVSDIWRGYAAQRILNLLNLRLVFSPALVKQDRNVHNYLADFDSENDLYLRSTRLLEQLTAWEPTPAARAAQHPLCACIEEMWVMMYEAGYIEINDLHLTQAWLKSLLAAGYKFPTSIRPSVVTVAVPSEPSTPPPVPARNKTA